MKKFFFVFSLLIAILVVLGYVFFMANNVSIAPITSWTESIRNIFSADQLTVTGSTYWVFSISQWDYLLYSKGSDLPILEGVSSEKLTLGKGIYFLALDNIYSTLEVFTPRLQIKHLVKGAYIVDTQNEQTVVYSLTGFLNVGIRSSPRAVENITEVAIFPTQYFVMDANASLDQMRWADVFRISQINTLSALFPNTPGSFKRIFWVNDLRARELFDTYSQYRKARSLELVALSTEFGTSDQSEVTFFEKYGGVLINPTKKRSLYYRLLVKRLQQLQELATASCSKEDCAKELKWFTLEVKEIKRVIGDIIDLSAGDEKTVRTLVREYAVAMSLLTPRRNDTYNELIFDSLFSLVSDSTLASEKKRTGYLPMRNLYTRYIFEWQDEWLHWQELQRYVEYIVDNNLLWEREFLWFIYFLGDILRSNKLAQASNISLFKLLLKIANSHVQSLSTDTQKQSILSVFYYIISGIASSLQSSLVTELFTWADLTNIELKGQFLLWSVVNLDGALIPSIRSLIDQYNIFDTSYGPTFDVTINSSSDITLTSRALSRNAFNAVEKIENILLNYSDYRAKISLDSNVRSTTGLEALKDPLDLATLTKFLSRFNGVDVPSITIMNDLTKDVFYDVKVLIAGKSFQFRLTPYGHVIERVRIEENGVLNTSFERISQSIDDREKLLQEQLANTTSPSERAKFDIKNYFLTTFSEKTPDSIGSPSPLTVNSESSMTPQMQLFVQSNLIEKDFLLVKDVLSIPIQAIYATIENGAYSIRVNGATSTLSDSNRSYMLVVDADYVFNQDVHAFQNIRFQVRSDQGLLLFNGVKIGLLPERIDTRNFSNLWSEITPYITRLTQQNLNPNSIIIDLSAKTVIVDWNTISP